MALRVFVSHSHKDAAWCDPFVDALASYGVDVWYDRKGLYAGAQWVRTIEDELSARDVFLIVITPESWASEWVREELALAFAAKRRIVGIIMKHTQVSGFILGRQMIDVVGQNAASAAKTVAASLGVTATAVTSTAVTSTAPAQAPVASTSDQLDVTGKWIEGSPDPWVLLLNQNGPTIEGRQWRGDVTWNSTSFHPVTGGVDRAKVTLSFSGDTSDWLFSLALANGRLVGSRRSKPHRASNYGLDQVSVAFNRIESS